MYTSGLIASRGTTEGPRLKQAEDVLPKMAVESATELRRTTTLLPTPSTLHEDIGEIMREVGLGSS